VFILYAVAIGLLLGVLLGGRPAGLASLRIRWSAAIAFGLCAQVVLFFGPVADRVGDAGKYLYVATTLLVIVAVLRNRAIAWMPLVAAGAAANLAAIVANGGYMPSTLAALAAAGKHVPTGYSNSAVLPSPALWPFTDIFALPAWLPWSNVFSVGDMLIGIGVALVIITAMRRPVTPAADADPAPAEAPRPA
jgi:hypothetical protein